MAQALNIWMNGELAGTWRITRTGTHTLTYASGWLESKSFRPLSLSLPVTRTLHVSGAAVENYFDNLLPDSEVIRRRIQARFGTKSTQPISLLAALGRDCVGAVQLLPPDDEPSNPRSIDSSKISDLDVENILRGVAADPAFGMGTDDGDDFRISIAGVQEKTALLRLNGRWHVPHGSTPTTHIFKLPIGALWAIQADMSDSVENEWICLRTLRELGFDVAHAEVQRFGSKKALVVERFDRRWVEKKWIARLPQEDFCQATGTPPRMKYESSGGPGVTSSLSVLSGSDERDADSLKFVLVQLAYWLLAAVDGHAKNFSIFIKPGGGYEMTPLYDVVSIWPVIGTGPSKLPLQKAKLAMALHGKNAHYKLAEIQTRHWHQLATQSGVPDAFDAMVMMVEQAKSAVEKVIDQLPVDFPTRVSKPIVEGVRRQARLFQSGLMTIQ